MDDGTGMRSVSYSSGGGLRISEADEYGRTTLSRSGAAARDTRYYYWEPGDPGWAPKKSGLLKSVVQASDALFGDSGADPGADPSNNDIRRVDYDYDFDFSDYGSTFPVRVTTDNGMVRSYSIHDELGRVAFSGTEGDPVPPYVEVGLEYDPNLAFTDVMTPIDCEGCSTEGRHSFQRNAVGAVTRYSPPQGLGPLVDQTYLYNTAGEVTEASYVDAAAPGVPLSTVTTTRMPNGDPRVESVDAGDSGKTTFDYYPVTGQVHTVELRNVSTSLRPRSSEFWEPMVV
ncbi:MAG: hypothetical protein ACI9WU_004911 [Myxococcota bacterium]